MSRRFHLIKEGTNEICEIKCMQNKSIDTKILTKGSSEIISLIKYNLKATHLMENCVE